MVLRRVYRTNYYTLVKMIFRTLYFATLFTYFLFSCRPKPSAEQDLHASKTDTTLVVEVNTWWNMAKFDSAFAYMYGGTNLTDTIVVSGKLHSTVRPSSKRQLNKSQINEIRGYLAGTRKEPDHEVRAQSDCFQPSQGFVFYSGGVISAHLSICYACGRNMSVPEGHYFNNESVVHIFEELGLPVLRDEGMLYEYRRKN